MKLLTAAVLAFSANSACAADADIEERYRALLYELRCLVCQNQSLADSDAELAGDLRSRVRTLLEEGKTDAEVVAHLRARYGDYVLYRPVFSPVTVLLWFGPFALLLLVSVLLVRRIRRVHARKPGPMTREERTHLKNILDDTGPE